MKKLNAILFASLALFLAVLSCGSSDSDTDETASSVSVTLSPETYNATALAVKFTINVQTSAKEWTAYGSDEWITVKIDAPSSTVAVSLSENKGAQRSGTVTFKSGTTRKTVTVTQAAPLSVEPTSLFFKSEGGEKTITVNYTGEWTATTTDSWLSCKVAGNTLTVTATEDKGDNRTGTITVKTVDESVNIEVSQDGATGVKCPLAGYSLVWNDEFDAEKLSGDWTFQEANPGWVNNEKQTYVRNDSKSCWLSDGTLKICAYKNGNKVISSRIYGCVKTGWQYGYVEASIKLPKGKGTWPAFWMMPVNFKAWPDDGEIDIMEEVGYHPDYVSSSLHAIGHVHSNNTQVTKEVYCKGAEGEFHTYGMEWTKDYFQFYVDGQKTLYYKNPGTGKRDWPYDAPFYVIFNLAWGGDWGGAQGIDEKALPATMEVDYVRVFQKK